MTEEKKVQERRRNIIVLITRYLVNLGYYDTAAKLQNDSNISLDNWYSFMTEIGGCR
jgi:katanin p60 ATPase-containing subunit A1